MKTCPDENLPTAVYGSFIHKRPNLEAARQPVPQQGIGQTAARPHLYGAVERSEPLTREGSEMQTAKREATERVTAATAVLEKAKQEKQ